MSFINEALERHWNLGRNVIIAWAITADALLILAAPFASLSRFIDQRAPNGRNRSHIKADEFLSSVLSGSRLMSEAELTWIARTLDAEVQSVPFVEAASLTDLELEQIDLCVRRYGMQFKRERAVLLVDIVDFSLADPVKQITLINSLSLSLNWAERQLQLLRSGATLARSSTGDGFYVWNRDDGLCSSRDLYDFLHLVLTHNALQASASAGELVPRLKVAFHIGNYCDLYQCNGLKPGEQSIIVGNVTVELARILEPAQPGQIIIGDFMVSRAASAAGHPVGIDTVEFLHDHQSFLDRITPFTIDGRRVEQVRCYLTGPRRRNGSYDVSVYRITDKHGKQRDVFNAKLNIVLDAGQTIQLGLQDAAVALFRAGRVRG